MSLLSGHHYSFTEGMTLPKSASRFDSGLPVSGNSVPSSAASGCGSCCVGNGKLDKKCLCGCQPYNSELTMNIDPAELERLRQKCTCSCCGVQFHNQSNLRRHEKVHFNIYQHQCSICGQKFSRSDTLKLHLRRKHRRFDLDKDIL